MCRFATPHPFVRTRNPAKFFVSPSSCHFSRSPLFPLDTKMAGGRTPRRSPVFSRTYCTVSRLSPALSTACAFVQQKQGERGSIYILTVYVSHLVGAPTFWSAAACRRFCVGKSTANSSRGRTTLPVRRVAITGPEPSKKIEARDCARASSGSGSEGCARECTPPPVVGFLGRTYGVRNCVVYNGESCRHAIGDRAT